jgi:hypothetical protein
MCKIIRVRYSSKCQCNRKVIKVFGKIFLTFHSSESKGVGRILFLIFLYYSSNSESTVPRIYTTISTVEGHIWHPCCRERPLFPIARVLVTNSYRMTAFSPAKALNTALA